MVQGAGNRKRLDDSTTEFIENDRSEFVGFSTTQTQTTVDIQEFVREQGLLSFLPLAKVELTASGIIAAGFKVKVGGGFSYPGYNRFNVSAMYLFGAGR